MTLTALLDELARERIAVSYDGRNVRLWPSFGSEASEALSAAVVQHRERLAWLCLHRLRPEEPARPAWEFWFRWDQWIDFCNVKRKGDKE